MSMENTPISERLHVGIFGRMNSGKSTLLNAITGQNAALTSPVKGTTTDPVYKPMELHGVGPVVFIDTAGFDDTGELGEKRIAQTLLAAEKTDVALLVWEPGTLLTGQPLPEPELRWLRRLRDAGKKCILILNKTDTISARTLAVCRARIEEAVSSLAGTDAASIPILTLSAGSGSVTETVRTAIAGCVPEDFRERTLTGNLCRAGDAVVLVMPQDIQAPKGRLILPQVRVLRELLDKKCRAFCCTADQFPHTLRALIAAPELVITDSQVFARVRTELNERYGTNAAVTPETADAADSAGTPGAADETDSAKRPETADSPAPRLTSFSILLAAEKGDIKLFLEGAHAMKRLPDGGSILIAEACTHAPLSEDIGTVKIPRLLREKYPGVHIRFVRGADFPDTLTDENGRPRYDLIIQCGSCMANRAFVLARQEKARCAGIPLTNYGLAIAQLTGILPAVAVPGIESV